jgi:hypothetical protein
MRSAWGVDAMVATEGLFFNKPPTLPMQRISGGSMPVLWIEKLVFEISSR